MDHKNTRGEEKEMLKYPRTCQMSQNGVERRKTKSFGVKNRMAQLSLHQSISCRNLRAMDAPVIPREIQSLKKRDANQRSEGKPALNLVPSWSIGAKLPPSWRNEATGTTSLLWRWKIRQTRTRIQEQHTLPRGEK
jgi:hypothetical protein